MYFLKINAKIITREMNGSPHCYTVHSLHEFTMGLELSSSLFIGGLENWGCFLQQCGHRATVQPAFLL